MTVPAAKVKALCTASEVSLVRSSRKAELAQLDGAEVKKLAILARQLRDKWRDLNRRQSRARGPKNDPARRGHQLARQGRDLSRCPCALRGTLGATSEGGRFDERPATHEYQEASRRRASRYTRRGTQRNDSGRGFDQCREATSRATSRGAVEAGRFTGTCCAIDRSITKGRDDKVAGQEGGRGADSAGGQACQVAPARKRRAQQGQTTARRHRGEESPAWPRAARRPGFVPTSSRKESGTQARRDGK